MKKILLSLAVILTAAYVKADEGMWPVESIPKNVVEQLRKIGAANLLEGSSLKHQKAVVIFGAGCTGSFISEGGLVLTNHHCASDYLKQLANNSTNLLKDGYFAKKRSEELPVPGLTISILEGAIDVTKEVDSLKQVLEGNTPMFIAKRMVSILEKKYFAKKGLECEIKTSTSNGKSTLYGYKIYKDVRLVFAPSMGMGRFGGNADNFEWERYQLDFSLFRVYADSQDQPADYSANNQPLKPEKWLTISDKSIKEGSKTFTIGFPGATSRQLTSEQLQTATIASDSTIAAIRNSYLAQLPALLPLETSQQRELHEKIFSYANVAKLSEGRYKGYVQTKLYDATRNEELQLPADEKLLVDEINRYSKKLRPYIATHTALIESMFRGTAILTPGMRSINLVKSWKDTTARKAALQSLAKWYADFEPTIVVEQEKSLLLMQLKNFAGAPLVNQAEELKRMCQLPEQQLKHQVDSIFEASIFTSTPRFKSFLQKGELEQLTNDKLFKLASEAYSYALTLKKDAAPWQDSIRKANRKLWQIRQQRGLMVNPDANFTMRLSVGEVSKATSYSGTTKPSVTTLGDLAKVDGTKEAYKLEGSLKKAILKNPNAQKTALCFTTTNDITGGNSGSPVLNSYGELVGVAFDGSYESLLGDYKYLAKYNRAVNLSIEAIRWYVKQTCPEAEVNSELER